MDKRSERVQPIKLSPDFFQLDLHKSMFINDLTVTIPSVYVKGWGKKIIAKHNQSNYNWDVVINYESPKDIGRKKHRFDGKLSLSFSKNRNKESNYRMKWNKDFAVQLAKDYPKSFVRSLEFHIGDDFYKKRKFTEYDIGGFKEQLQIKIQWVKGKPIVHVKEFFKVKEESQGFPNVFKELSSYLIADYLLSDEKEILRRVQVSEWKPRKSLKKELNENNIYLLLNRENNQIYIGETRKSMSQRYPEGIPHHTFKDWNEYSIIQLPPETSDHTRILIERVLITMGVKLFRNKIGAEVPLLDLPRGYELMNRRK